MAFSPPLPCKLPLIECTLNNLLTNPVHRIWRRREGFTWLVKLLLSQGYVVHGTVRDPDDPRNTHLKKMENSENLKLFRADVLDLDSLPSAFKGCEGVFHSACPVPVKEMQDPEAEVFRPAVEGTLNVLKACLEEKVKRVVLVSSFCTSFWNPNWPIDEIMDERCWSDKELFKNNKMWYHLGKTVAEEKAFEFSKSSGLDVISVCPPLILGPMLQSTVNYSSLVIIKLMKGMLFDLMRGNILHMVDVRDVAQALLIVYEKPEANGRYLCSPYCIEEVDFIAKFKRLYPNFTYPESSYEENPYHRLSSKKLEMLGWSHMELEQCIRDSVEDYCNRNLLDMAESDL